MTDHAWLKHQIRHIDYNRVATQRLFEETQQLLAERSKLDAESRKLNRDPWIIMAAAIIGAAGIIASRLPEILTAWRG